MSTPKNEPSLFIDPGRAWEPYQPGPKAPWDAARVAHLHRRAGLGATWGQLQRDLNDGFEPSLRRILEGEAQGPSGQPSSEFADTVAAMEESAQRRPSMVRVQMLWLYRLIFTPFPLQEVMTLAWHGHYATSQAKVNSAELMLAQNNALRTLWRAPISKLHLRMLNDGAMRRWLDGLNSTKAQPNENLGREFLELFALGEGTTPSTTSARWRGADRLAQGRYSTAPRSIRSGRFRRWCQDDPGPDRTLGPGRRGADRLPASSRRHPHCPTALSDFSRQHR